ncbi:hypothetical protein [Pseudoalteromonas tunicata]|jgi:pyrrolidone-carboxylate peptidase|uniref:Pyrrolidone-carboxylate peptidase n=1 Tax=Pseudoalteromonas tunicata D2 TaxID=87626 RepID=A4CFE9_9GAMM|nr:hypothetical protein [Pseudoalteromonas tunicata]ATC92916.1 hypothetical protein PTUN_a0071 [Pseudoalteromonas tunicata]AXT32016.1 hypothetical protein D1819_15110 [Pseudoalteromonas tunicata]EAR26587.1 hypothetical protein PTD2_09579 [Pseudoalteromonas tunicata D2]
MKKISIALSLLFITSSLCAATLTIEEQRIDKAMIALPHLSQKIEQTERKALDILNQKNYEAVRQDLYRFGESLWQSEVNNVQQGRLDDRDLYWQRLNVIKALKQRGAQFSNQELDALVEVFENSSRGRTELEFTEPAMKKILITGFDPFLLDRNIAQSNPSGIAALLLDGQVIEHNGIKAQINTLMVPVRYKDFDDGEIESALAPFYALNNIDLIATISMGRSDFDLEHFPGRRRSVTTPDNLNVLTGANPSSPIIPLLTGQVLAGPEFVQFSLPYTAMQQAKGNYKINDNREVHTLNKQFSPTQIHELKNEIAVEGGGGGYLSNEISYRSIRLKNLMGSTIPTGHIHTPRIIEFDEKTNQAVMNQIIEMLKLSLSQI